MNYLVTDDLGVRVRVLREGPVRHTTALRHHMLYWKTG